LPWRGINVFRGFFFPMLGASGSFGSSTMRAGPEYLSSFQQPFLGCARVSLSSGSTHKIYVIHKRFTSVSLHVIVN
jgi:hypothetical protein